jgi:hypothetical protein
MRNRASALLVGLFCARRSRDLVRCAVLPAARRTGRWMRRSFAVGNRGLVRGRVVLAAPAEIGHVSLVESMRRRWVAELFSLLRSNELPADVDRATLLGGQARQARPR